MNHLEQICRKIGRETVKETELVWEFPFGQHKGCRLDCASDDYIRWFFKHTGVSIPHRVADKKYAKKAISRSSKNQLGDCWSDIREYSEKFWEPW